MNCPDCKDPLPDAATSCPCGWKAAYRQAGRSPVRSTDPNSPENIEARTRALALRKQDDVIDPRSWITNLQERLAAGEILPAKQLQILKQRGLA